MKLTNRHHRKGSWTSRGRLAGSVLIIAGLGLSTAILVGVSGILYASKKKQAEKLAEAEAQIQQMSQLRKEAVNKDADADKAKATIEKLTREKLAAEAAKTVAERELAKVKAAAGLAEAEKTALQVENAELKIQIETLKLELKAAKSSNPKAGYRQLTSRKLTPKETCVNNLKQIQGAKRQWAQYEKKGPDDTPILSDIFGVVKFIKTQPYCPEGGEYKLGKVGEHPTCSHPGHSY